VAKETSAGYTQVLKLFLDWLWDSVQKEYGAELNMQCEDVKQMT